MTLRHIEIFAMVCREGSITRAAERLHLSQPTVSVAIRELEDHYKDPLFERISHRLYLTPFGHRIYDYSLSLLNLYSDMSEAQLQYETIRIGTGTAVGKLFLPKIVKAFQAEQSGIHVQVSVGDATRMYQLIMQNDLDYVIAETVDDIYGLAHRAIQCYPIVAVCHKDNPLASKSEIAASDLAEQNLLLREPGSNTRQLVEQYFRLNNIEVTPTWESYSVQTILNATIENLGVSFHSLDHVVACHDPSLVILNVPDFHSDRYVNISYHKDKIHKPSMQSFLDFYLKTTHKMLCEGVEAYNLRHPEAAYPLERILRGTENLSAHTFPPPLC